MNRSSSVEYENEIIEWESGIKDIIKDFNIKDEKVVLIDADSLVHFALWGKTEDGERIEYTINDIEDLKAKLRESVLKIFNEIETYFIMKGYVLFIKGVNNYRKLLYNKYKSNRPETNPLVHPLYECLIEEFGAISSDGFEAEDYVYTTHLTLGKENCIICYIDHDILEIGECLLYNYQKGKWLFQTEEEAKHHLAHKIVVSETSDNVNLCPGVGKKYFEKNFYKGMSNYSYLRGIFKAYIKGAKGNIELAKENLHLAWKLLKLQRVI